MWALGHRYGLVRGYGKLVRQGFAGTKGESVSGRDMGGPRAGAQRRGYAGVRSLHNKPLERATSTEKWVFLIHIA